MCFWILTQKKSNKSSRKIVGFIHSWAWQQSPCLSGNRKTLVLNFLSSYMKPFQVSKKKKSAAWDCVVLICHWKSDIRGRTELHLLLLASFAMPASTGLYRMDLEQACGLSDPEIKRRCINVQSVTKAGGHRRHSWLTTEHQGEGGVCSGERAESVKADHHWPLAIRSSSLTEECLRFLICFEHVGSQWWWRSIIGHVMKGEGKERGRLRCDSSDAFKWVDLHLLFAQDSIKMIHSCTSLFAFMIWTSAVWRRLLPPDWLLSAPPPRPKPAQVTPAVSLSPEKPNNKTCITT